MGINMEGKKWKRGEWRKEYPIWSIGVVLFVCLFTVGIVERVAPGFLEQAAPTCFIRQHVGIYCTGCGATRAVLAVVHGQFLQSIYFNAVVMYVILFYGVYVIRGAIYLLSKGKYRYMKFHITYVYVGLVIVIVQAIMKNVALFVWHYTWMS